jgi:hypothetical protein
MNILIGLNIMYTIEQGFIAWNDCRVLQTGNIVRVAIATTQETRTRQRAGDWTIRPSELGNLAPLSQVGNRLTLL